MSEASTTNKPDTFHRKCRQIKSKLYLKAHTLWWGLLWGLRLGKPYSKIMCRLNFYTKYADGRCMYCGKVKWKETHDRFLG